MVDFCRLQSVGAFLHTALVVVLLSNTVEAQEVIRDGPEPPLAPHSERLAVLVLATEASNQELADNLTEVLIAGIAEHTNTQIIGKEEFQSILQRQEEASLECLESDVCLGRVGVQLDVGEVVAGTIGRQGTSFAFHVNRTSISSGEVIRRVFRQVDGGLSELIDAVRHAAPALFEERPEVGGLRVRCSTANATLTLDGETLMGTLPFNRDDVAVGAHVVRVEAAGYHSYEEEVQITDAATVELVVSLTSTAADETSIPIAITAWSLLGLGAAGLVAAVVLGVRSQDGLPENETLSRRDALNLIDSLETRARSANVLFGVGGALTLAGTMVLIFARRHIFRHRQGAQPEVSLSLNRWSVAWHF